MDDNAFTNYMAGWMIRAADSFYLPAPDTASSVIEQFEGFYDCNDVDLANLRERVRSL